MRILVTTPFLPWPLDSGGNAAQFATLNCLSKDHHFVLLAPIYRRQDAANAVRLQELLPQVTIRAVYCGGQRKDASLVRVAAKRVAGVGRRLVKELERSKDSGTSGLLYNPFLPLPEALIGTIEEEIGTGCDLFQAEFANMMQLGSFIPGDIPKIFVHHQLHSIYATRAIAVGGDSGPYYRYLASTMRTQEIAYLREFDGVITFSHADREALLPFLSEDKVFTSPFPIPPDVRLNSSVSGVWDRRFVFLASEIHPPNRDGLEWLMAEIWPRIAKHMPDCTLHIIGNWGARRRKMYTAERVQFHGFVSNLQGVLANSIALVPLRVGSGIRVKILAAMASGVPVVSTTMGSEGIPVIDKLNIVIGDDPKTFASGAVTLASDGALRERIASAGLELIVDHYSPEGVRERRNQIYQEVLKRRE